MPAYPRAGSAPLALDPKDPQAVLDYVFDWQARSNGTEIGGTDWLAPNEEIVSHTVFVDAGITLDSSVRTNVSVHDGAGSTLVLADNTAVQVWLSGGDLRQGYNVTCRIVTNEGRTDERTIRIPIYDR